MEKRFGVLGGGSWGTALIKILLEKNSSLSWYIRNEENINYMEKIILREISGWSNNSINSNDNLKMTKQLYDKHAYNKKI